MMQKENDRSPFSPCAGNRGWISISWSILVCSIGGTRGTVLMRRAGLSTSQLQKYVKTLTKSQLLEVFKRGKRVTYQTTAKGRSFVEAFDELVKLMD